MTGTSFSLQSVDAIDAAYSVRDPWGYETNPHDHARKTILLGHLRGITPGRTLDIGCGHGFVTRDLPGESVVGVDVSHAAIAHARAGASPRHEYVHASVFDLTPAGVGTFDLIVVTGVLYPEYIGDALPVVYLTVDALLRPGGRLVSVHIDEWYRARFPFRLLTTDIYPYREYLHRCEVYAR